MADGLRTLTDSVAGKPFQNVLFATAAVLAIVLLASPYFWFALFPALLIMTLLLLGHFPKVAYYMIIVLIPFWTYRGLLGTYRFLKLHWLLALWLLVLLALQLLVRREEPGKLKTHLWPWLAIFFVVNLLSALLSQFPSTSFDSLFLLGVAYLFVVLSLTYLVTRKDMAVTLPAVLGISISISAFLSLVGYFFNVPLFAEGTEMGFKRGTGGTYDPNNLSLMIVFSLPLLAHWIFRCGSIPGKVMATGLLLMNIAAIRYTYSRGGTLVFLILLTLVLISKRKDFKPKFAGFVLLAAGVALAGAIAIVPSSYLEHMQRVASPEKERSIGIRAVQLSVGWEILKKHPFLGAGPGTFQDIYADTFYAFEFAPEITSRESLRHKAHNVYLEVLAGSGGFGLALFLVIIGIALRDFRRARRNFLAQGDREMESATWAYQFSFISLLVYFLLFSDMFHKYFLLSLAVSQIVLRLSLSGEEGKTRERVRES